MCTTVTHAMGYKDINMQKFYESNINKFLFSDFDMLLLVRWGLSNLIIQNFGHSRLSFLLEEIKSVCEKLVFDE